MRIGKLSETKTKGTMLFALTGDRVQMGRQVQPFIMLEKITIITIAANFVACTRVTVEGSVDRFECLFHLHSRRAVCHSGRWLYHLQ